jgi:carbon monoxide dehydrogenase subunit G
MLIENEFTVDAKPDDVFALLVDVERVGPCLPGTEVLGRREDGSYDGQMKVKLGPMRMAYKGTVAIAEQDAGARTATLQAKGVEARGQGSAQGTIAMKVVAPDGGGGSVVSVSTDIKLTGRVAQMGQGVMKDVATKMVGEMARSLEALLGDEGRRASTPPSVADPPPASDAGATSERPAAPGPAAPPPAPPRPAPSSGVSLRTIAWAVLRGRFAALGRMLRGRRAGAPRS